MARFEITSDLNALFDEMARLGEATGEVADEMLLAAAEVVKKEWQIVAAEHAFKKTGAMIESIGFPKGVQTVQDVRRVDIYPQGTDEAGVRNTEKAFLLHYGWSRFPASHWIDEADERSSSSVEETMLAIWDKHIEGRS